MAFDHESFWVTTSAVAPVIALAAVAALPDATLIGRAAGVLDRIQQRQAPHKDPWLDNYLAGAAQDIRKWASIGWLTTLVNLTFQASLLVVSLCALALRQDVMPFWLGICLAAVGVLLLAFSTLVSTEQRWTLESGLFHEGGAADSYIAPDDSADGGT